MRHLVNLSLLLAIFWLILSGHYTPLLLTFGLASVGLVVWLVRRMDMADHEAVPVHLTRHVATFWPWLLVEIVKSNIDVVRRILDPRLPIERMVIRVPTGGMEPLLATVYANAITLTPGTVALDVGQSGRGRQGRRDDATGRADGRGGLRCLLPRCSRSC